MKRLINMSYGLQAQQTTTKMHLSFTFSLTCMPFEMDSCDCPADNAMVLDMSSAASFLQEGMTL